MMAYSEKIWSLVEKYFSKGSLVAIQNNVMFQKVLSRSLSNEVNNFPRGGPRGRVVKVTDFSALDHSIISPMWVRASHGARIAMFCLRVCQVVFPRVLRFSPHLPIDSSRYE